MINRKPNGSKPNPCAANIHPDGSVANRPSAQLGTPDYTVKSRGSRTNIPGRFEKSPSFYDPASLGDEDEPAATLKTQVFFEQARSIITRNQSPDVPFDYTINPYRGCEHGCSYCFARPTHSYLDLSPGLDFESKLFVKENAPQLLVKSLANPNYRCQHFALGANTDCYQPIEKQFALTRRILEICLAFQHPVSIITKGALLSRDLDLLIKLNQKQLVSVAVSVTTLDANLKVVMGPRAAGVQNRLNLIRELVAHGIPVTVLVAPIIPKINDNEIEAILAAVADLGVKHVGYVLLRLPYELRDLFTDWLHTHFLEKANAVLSIMAACHQGDLYRAGFGVRQRGSGQFAELIQQRFQIAAKKFGLNLQRALPRTPDRFAVPKDLENLLTLLPWQRQRQDRSKHKGDQLTLF